MKLILTRRAERIGLLVASGLLGGVILFGVWGFGRVLAYNWGIEAYQRKDYGVASLNLRIAAELGIPKAMAVLGSMYALGTGVARDSPKAIAWLEQACEVNDVDALSFLGIMYMYGVGIPVDTNRGFALLRRAAVGGDNTAQAILLRMKP